MYRPFTLKPSFCQAKTSGRAEKLGILLKIERPLGVVNCGCEIDMKKGEVCDQKNDTNAENRQERRLLKGHIFSQNGL
jgi:hypothetical protein